MSKPRRYPTLLDLVRCTRNVAIAGGGALALLGSGCTLVDPQGSDQRPHGADVADVMDVQTVPDIAGAADLPIFADLAGRDAPLVIDMEEPEDPGPLEPDMPLAGAPWYPEPDAGDVPEPGDEGVAEEDVPLAGGMPLPEPEAD